MMCFLRQQLLLLPTLMLGQSEVAKYLDQCCGDVTSMEEVLSAYVVSKYLKGSTSERVLIKMRYLIVYLRATGRRHILETAADVLKVLFLEVSLGGGRVGTLPSRTAVGKTVWNRLRRETSSVLMTDAVYGGPGPVHSFLSTSQRIPFRNENTRSAWAERYFVARQASGQVPNLHENTTAGHRATTLPLYCSRDYTENMTTAYRTPSLPAYASRDYGMAP
ncbi:hypothetical protein HMN09_00249700 [Mycena chlorophos]|uniref:Uncharacterized protein n=1 Tax=Mycena chlorophos TaxID=658473 RepID=A0A8H6TJZ2_MYCCL|nr:hypothetical protein HMN09_00249700 [Mycena chlorophos]